jgi:hypothetical protein
MQEICLSGSEGGGASALPTPYKPIDTLILIRFRGHAWKNIGFIRSDRRRGPCGFAEGRSAADLIGCLFKFNA